MEGRYDRHFVLNEIKEEGQKKLLSSKVFLVGAGGLGSSAALYLAAAGVGTIGICDADAVEITNLQRQIIHDTTRVGENKAFSARKRINDLNPDVKVETFPFRLNTENILDIISGYDFILDCTDVFESKFLINDACVLQHKPYSHAGVVRFSGQLLTYVPGKGPCLRCLLGSVPKKGASPLCKEVGVLGAVVGIIGCMQAVEAIKYLLGIGDLLTGKILRFDALSMKSEIFSFEKPNRNCLVCGGAPFSLKDHRAEYGE